MSGPSRDGALMADINVTPFVDVMLVLLIIFMVTAPLMTTGVALELPRAEAPSLAPDEDQLVLSVTADETYYLGKNAFPLEELKVKLAAIAKANPEQQMFVRADGKLAYEKVLQLLAVAQNAGVAKVGLVTQPGPVVEGLGEAP
ncbi:MAG: biopolymer transporter ExbD [Pseudomonadota bacterium]|nr:biopolymer transporter ExbD [Pseudomonadota bacterium]